MDKVISSKALGLSRSYSLWTLLAILAAFCTLALNAIAAVPLRSVAATVPAGIDNAEYDRLLKKYVNETGLVAYERWKSNAEDMHALDAYVQKFAAPGSAAKGDERHASLVNAYNAFVLQWILQNYPTESIWTLKSSFKAKRYNMGGTMVSLEDIEHGMLRPEIGYRAHAVLVCAARSCPPLQRSAYSAGEFSGQVDHAYRTWLGRTDLNEFGQGGAEVSSIFKWFSNDFDAAGGANKIIAKYAPSEARATLANADTKLTFKKYNWGLNDQGSHGRNYSSANLLLDNLF